MAEWQSQWNSETRVARWIREISWNCYYLPPSAGFHGACAFGEYLHRFDIQDSPEGSHFDAEVDDVEHTLFAYPYWDQMRTRTVGLVGHTILLEDVETIFCGPGRGQVIAVPDSVDGAITR